MELGREGWRCSIKQSTGCPIRLELNTLYWASHGSGWQRFPHNFQVAAWVGWDGILPFCIECLVSVVFVCLLG